MSSPEPALVITAPNRIVIQPRSSDSSSVVVDGNDVRAGGHRPFTAAAAALSGSDVGSLLSAAPFLPGADVAVPILPKHLKDNSVGLGRLQPIPVPKGGTGRTSFAAGHALFGAGGGNPPGEGEISADGSLAWDDLKKELVVSGRLHLGGLAVSVSPAVTRLPTVFSHAHGAPDARPEEGAPGAGEP